MRVTFPTGSIMWAKTPNTDDYMPYRMRVLLQLWRVTYGNKTELIAVRFSNNGGVHGDTNHPEGSALELPLGTYCYVVYNLSENQVPINQIVIRGDSTNTNSLFGLAPDIANNACYRKVESGQKGEIYFNVENFEGSQYYHLDSNAWFVNGFEFSSVAVDTVTNYGLNPLTITLQEDVIYFFNKILGNQNFVYLYNTVTFQGSNILNPFYVANKPEQTSGSASGTVVQNGVITTPPPPSPATPKSKRTRNLILGFVGILGFISFKKNGDTNRNTNR